MHRDEWADRAGEFSRAAHVLLRSGLASSAYYTAGLAVECQLKSGISRAFRRNVWPDKAFVIGIHSHKLSQLVAFAGLSQLLNAEKATLSPLWLNWQIVSGWDIEARYASRSTIEATDMVEAINARGSGVLAWLKRSC